MKPLEDETRKRAPGGDQTRCDGGMWKRAKAEAGQTLLEFALMLPFLLLLGVGVVEIGRAIAFTITVNNAATAGVEFGAQDSATALDLDGMVDAAIVDANFGPTTATATYGCTCDKGTGASCTYPVPGPQSCPDISCDGGQIVQCVQVTTHAAYTPIFHYPGLPARYEANGRAVMRVRK